MLWLDHKVCVKNWDKLWKAPPHLQQQQHDYESQLLCHGARKQKARETPSCQIQVWTMWAECAKTNPALSLRVQPRSGARANQGSVGPAEKDRQWQGSEWSMERIRPANPDRSPAHWLGSLGSRMGEEGKAWGVTAVPSPSVPEDFSPAYWTLNRV